VSTHPALAGARDVHVDEAVWRAADWHTRPAAVLPPAGARVLVVSAHPDDEVLALGGTLALLAARGCRLTLVTATDGEGSHPGLPPDGSARLARRRADELRDALDVLGVRSDPLRLGLPDSGLTGREDDLRAALTGLAQRADLVVGTWSHDAHPDHEAVGRACRALDAAPVWEVPVWAWHWAVPGDPRFPWDDVRLVDVSEQLERKAEAITRFASQLEPRGEAGPVLPPEVLSHFTRPFEVVLT
jgi:LmbE family N-acetylglucosaminyl deacetylase